MSVGNAAGPPLICQTNGLIVAYVFGKQKISPTFMKRNIKAPTGSELTCKNWLIEAAYRMIQNNLDAEVAFDPDNLIVYGGRGKAARDWRSFDAILESLKNLETDETLL